jgi:hypothetical protein
LIGNYAQQGPRAPWQNKILGHGGSPGTIGQYGCYVTSWADVATWGGYPTDPGQMDDLFNAAGIFVSEADGTFDMMPGDDAALPQLWPARFAMVGHWGGRRDDLIAAALPTPDQYTVLSLAWPGHTHFVPVVGGSGPDWLIGDSWDGVTKHLSAYGLGTVTKTIIVRALPKGPDPALAAAAAARVAAAAKAASDAKASTDAQAAADLAAEQAKIAAEAAKVTADAQAAAEALAAAQAAEAARVAAETAATQAAAAQAVLIAAAAAHAKAIKDAAALKPMPSFWALLQAFLIALFRSTGHAQAAINKVQKA